MMAIKDVWTNFQQGNEELNSWIARISNAVQLANYAELNGMTIKDRLVRDILLTGCNSQKAKSRIMKEGPAVLLPAVIKFCKKRDRLLNSKPNLSIMSNMMLRKARNARSTV